MYSTALGTTTVWKFYHVLCFLFYYSTLLFGDNSINSLVVLVDEINGNMILSVTPWYIVYLFM